MGSSEGSGAPQASPAAAITAEKFWEWLKNQPAELARLVSVVKEFYNVQGTVTLPGGGSGPTHYVIGGEQASSTVPIADADIEALTKGYAEGIVIEKAIAFVKGFITGVMLAM